MSQLHTHCVPFSPKHVTTSYNAPTHTQGRPPWRYRVAEAYPSTQSAARRRDASQSSSDASTYNPAPQYSA